MPGSGPEWQNPSPIFVTAVKSDHAPCSAMSEGKIVRGSVGLTCLLRGAGEHRGVLGGHPQHGACAAVAGLLQRLGLFTLTCHTLSHGHMDVFDFVVWHSMSARCSSTISQSAWRNKLQRLALQPSEAKGSFACALPVSWPHLRSKAAVVWCACVHTRAGQSPSLRSNSLRYWPCTAGNGRSHASCS